MLTVHENNESNHICECGTLEDAERVAFALIQTNGGKVVIRNLKNEIVSIMELGTPDEIDAKDGKRKLSRREMNWKGVYAAQGRNGWWFVSTGYDPRTNKPVADDADDTWLLSKHDINDAYNRLAELMESGAVI